MLLCQACYGLCLIALFSHCLTSNRAGMTSVSVWFAVFSCENSSACKCTDCTTLPWAVRQSHLFLIDFLSVASRSYWLAKATSRVKQVCIKLSAGYCALKSLSFTGLKWNLWMLLCNWQFESSKASKAKYVTPTTRILLSCFRLRSVYFNKGCDLFVILESLWFYKWPLTAKYCELFM